MVDQMSPVDSQCPSWAAALGYMGVASAVCLSNWGAAVSRGSWRVGNDETFELFVTPSRLPVPVPVAYSTVQYGRHVPSEIFLGSKNTWEGKKQTIGRNHGVYCSSFSPFSLLSFYINEYSWEHGSRGLALSTQELDTLVPL